MLIGIDAVDIVRFEEWHNFSKTKLSRILSPEEIDYCLSNPLKSAERFAVRFAAREAFFKALMNLKANNLPLMQVMKHISVKRQSSGQAELEVNWQALGFDKNFDVQLSLTHTRTTAVAVVLINHEGKS